MNREILTEEESAHLIQRDDPPRGEVIDKILRIHGQQNRELDAVYGMLASFPRWMCEAFDTEVERRAARDEEEPQVLRLVTSMPPSAAQVELARIQAHREEVQVIERLEEIPPDRSMTWIVILVAVGLVTMGVIGSLCGLRYYARYCAPGAREGGSAEICSQAAEWKP